MQKIILWGLSMEADIELLPAIWLDFKKSNFAVCNVTDTQP